LIKKLMLAGLCGLMLTACAGAATTATAPVAKLVAPQDGATFAAGLSIAIVGEASGAAVVEVQIKVNGATIATQPAVNGAAAVALSWLPEQPGQQVIHIEAHDAAGTVIARSALAAIRVEAPTATPAPSTAIRPTAARPTSQQVTAPPPTAAAPLTPSLTISNTFANVRSGPGLNFAVLGQVQQGTQLAVSGKSADGAWWQVTFNGAPGWLFGELTQPNAAAAGVAVAQAPIAPPATATPVATPVLVAVAPAATEAPAAPAAPPTATPNPAEAGMPPCNPNNPHWAVIESKDPGYTFCSAAPFEFVGETGGQVLTIRWHIYGIEKLELRVDPNGSGCGLGSKGYREWVPFKTENYQLNRQHFPRGGYKIGLWATLADGRVQDYGELNFCGDG
jgi:uncharacterized protein YraI